MYWYVYLCVGEYIYVCMYLWVVWGFVCECVCKCMWVSMYLGVDIFFLMVKSGIEERR